MFSKILNFLNNGKVLKLTLYSDNKKKKKKMNKRTFDYRVYKYGFYFLFK